MPGLVQAFKDAGAPLHNALNNWSAMAPDRSFIVVTIWEHEFDKMAGKEPRLGPVVDGAYRYFWTTAEHIAEWDANRIRAGRPKADSTVGWPLMKGHLAEAFERKLPVRVVYVSPVKGTAPDGTKRATTEDASFK